MWTPSTAASFGSMQDVSNQEFDSSFFGSTTNQAPPSLEANAAPQTISPTAKKREPSFVAMQSQLVGFESLKVSALQHISPVTLLLLRPPLREPGMPVRLFFSARHHCSAIYQTKPTTSPTRHPRLHLLRGSSQPTTRENHDSTGLTTSRQDCKSTSTPTILPWTFSEPTGHRGAWWSTCRAFSAIS